MILRLTIDAFAATPATASVLAQLPACPVLGKSRTLVFEGGIPAATRHYAETPTPQVVIVEDTDGDRLTQHLDALSEVCEPGTRVLVIGPVNDIELYRRLLAHGVSDYLVTPVTADRILEAIARMFTDPGTAPEGRVIACWGARGGAGSSSVAQNLAWSLGRHLKDTVVYIDLDLAFGTSTLAFNLDAKQTLADALAHPDRLDDVLIDRCMAEYDDYLHILAAPGDGRCPPAMPEEALERLIGPAARMARVVVLDLPHLGAEWTLQRLATADEALIIATPDFASLRDTKTLFETLANRPRAPRLILNKIDPSCKNLPTPKDFEEIVHITPALLIPLDTALFGDAAANAQMLGETQPGHKIPLMLTQLAATLTGKPPPAKTGGAWWPRLLAWARR